MKHKQWWIADMNRNVLLDGPHSSERVAEEWAPHVAARVSMLPDEVVVVSVSWNDGRTPLSAAQKRFLDMIDDGVRVAAHYRGDHPWPKCWTFSVEGGAPENHPTLTAWALMARGTLDVRATLKGGSILERKRGGTA